METTKSNSSESDVNAKWDACLDLTARRFVYSSLGGAFAGLLFFRSPVTRWASIAFGAGIGIGSAYTDCSRVFDASSSTSATLLAAPKSTETSVSQVSRNLLRGKYDLEEWQQKSEDNEEAWSVVLYTDVKIVNDPLIFFVLKNLMFFYLRNNSSGLICLPLLFLHSSNNLLTYRLSYRF
ncbi:MICOS complex subunit Mic10-like protein (DUF543) [Arabidopsis thaliana]|uniref:MICOS complex subunit Mic10-like protein (DUF543) n=1 Tax=Arabidopsis thaliana TaxID=3702 RepID=F4I1E5_ARATH|nr:MICOS complex subunit Mic10-like protein (DUF543) [Arabidopsis thaliana]AEE30252.1 MICOS complex subunit Mic10-like protein (DUF543) [Arabidopsis thaliana]|eukprot:NP_001154357.1 MICOS complex subunit Mic10-like protein (DUF543) [Arabidopsis thaliana]